MVEMNQLTETLSDIVHQDQKKFDKKYLNLEAEALSPTEEQIYRFERHIRSITS